MDALRSTLEGIVLDPKYAGLLALVKTARNGAVYGAKVRFPHALVMIFLFRSGSFREKVGLILKATRTHARNLALFAMVYKIVILLLRNSPRGLADCDSKETTLDPFLAGLVGGYFVFGRGIQSSVNQQIVTYIFARVVLGIAKLSVQEGGPVPEAYRGTITQNAWPVFASLSWAAVMWLYRYHDYTLLPSLRSSMKYIYSDCDEWSDLRTLLWHNK